MTTARLAGVLSFALAAAAGCASAPSRFYTLDAAATPDAAPVARYAVVVGPVSIPPAVDRPEFVLQVAPNRVELDEFNRWAAPLGDGIARAVAGNLALLLGTPDVATGPLVGLDPAYRVTIAVQRFEASRGGSALVDAVWTVRGPKDGGGRSGHSLGRKTIQGEGFDAIAAAYSGALVQVSEDIAAAIRAEADRAGRRTR